MPTVRDIRDDGYHELANAIVLQAIEDYRYAVIQDYVLEKEFASGKINDDKYLKKSQLVRKDIRSLARFFRGAWCLYLTEMDCPHLPKKLKTETIEFARLAENAFSDPRTDGIDKAVWEQMPDKEKDKFKKAFRCPTCGGEVNMTYGYIGWDGSRYKRFNRYGWRLKCAGCGFKFAAERERIEAKGDQVDEEQCD